MPFETGLRLGNATMPSRIGVDPRRDDGLTIPGRAVPGASCTPDCGSHSGLRWYCLQHKPGQLHVAEANLGIQAFETWYPLRRGTHRRGRKLEEVLRPVFVGFVFVRFDVANQRWRTIVHTRGVHRLFSVAPERPLPIRPGVIEKLQAEQDKTGFLPRPTNSLVEAGAAVRINSQALAFHGQVGPVLNVDGAGVHVQVQMFGRAVPIVLAESALELVAPAPAAGKAERSAA